MSIVSISLDTQTRMVALTVDGNIVSIDSVFISMSTDYDGKPYLRFEYTTRSKNDSGLEEIHGFFLPPPEDCESCAKANDQGVVEQPVVDAGKAVADIQAFFAQAKPTKGQMPDKHARSPEMQQMVRKHQENTLEMMGAVGQKEKC